MCFVGWFPLTISSLFSIETSLKVDKLLPIDWPDVWLHCKFWRVVHDYWVVICDLWCSVYMGSPPTRDKVPRSEEKGRTRRVQNREKRGLKTGRSYSEDLTKMLPTWCDKKTSPQSGNKHGIYFFSCASNQHVVRLKRIVDQSTSQILPVWNIFFYSAMYKLNNIHRSFANSFFLYCSFV